MKSSFLNAAFFFLVTAISGILGCDPDTGPAGVTDCFLDTPYYSKHQCGTCVTNAYMRQVSKGKFQCPDTTATYCYYQCMLEKYSLDRGPVYDDCLCKANVSVPQRPAILPPECFSPDGTDCAWYRQCLNKMIPCTGQTEYAISYGEKFCNLYEQSRLKFSQKGLQWINAVRKCLQVALVPVLHFCQVQPTCEDIRTKAFHSHVPCYVQPYEGLSVCTLPVMDWFRIFWTIKSSFEDEFVETFIASVKTAADCLGIYAEEIGKKLYSIRVRLWENNTRKQTANKLPDDELAHAVVLRVSSSLGWDQHSTIDWYAFAANVTDGENSLTTPSTVQSGRELIIQA